MSLPTSERSERRRWFEPVAGPPTTRGPQAAGEPAPRAAASKLGPDSAVRAAQPGEADLSRLLHFRTPTAAAPTRPGETDELRPLLAHFGFDPGQVPPALRQDLARALMASRGAFATGLSGEGALRVEQRESPEGSSFQLSFDSPEGRLELTASLSAADGRLRTALVFESHAGRRVDASSERALLVRPVEGGVLLMAAEPDRSSVPEIEPESREGLGAFVTGAVLGDFAGEPTWSGAAGQTLLGFVPIAGQVADLRDLTAAALALGRGEPGAPLFLAAAVLGFVPGLDWMKTALKAPRRLLIEAHRNLSPVAVEGLRVAKTRLGPVAGQLAEDRLRDLMAARQAIMHELQDLIEKGSLPKNTQEKLETALRALEDHAKDADLVGALRDRLGVPVRRASDGKVYDHAKEVETAFNSLENLSSNLRRLLGGRGVTNEHLRDLSKLTDDIEGLARRLTSYQEIK